ncbi:MAG: 4-hydroxy-tetrahydrodipicolinate reductase [Nitrospinae bacterium]|nr:4-hydroxy-tetrahydrodipicolinate reductase [Nitrospinota bacterium]
MAKIVVTGCAGKMGRRIVNVIEDTDGAVLAGGTEAPGSPFAGQDVGDVAGIGHKGAAISTSLKEIIAGCDAVIDFSVPAASLDHFHIAAEAGKAIVIGTTGFNEEHWKTFESMAKSCRAVIAPNMSVGVNVLFKLVRDAARIMGQTYDIEMFEMHHNQKVDSPSGTAVKLAEIAAGAVGRDLKKVGVFGREGQIGKRKPEEIGVMTLRGGDVVGEHTVMFAGTGERVELTHRAWSRDNFAMGAVRAAMWIVKQPNGIYDMQDVLGLK